jgi:hypothetical protein
LIATALRATRTLNLLGRHSDELRRHLRRLHTPGAVTIVSTRRDGSVVHLVMAITPPGLRAED